MFKICATRNYETWWYRKPCCSHLAKVCPFATCNADTAFPQFLEPYYIFHNVHLKKESVNITLLEFIKLSTKNGLKNKTNNNNKLSVMRNVLVNAGTYK